MASDIIVVQALKKTFPVAHGELIAVDGVSFNVAEGEVFGFLGPNGAGKSTTINILATLLPATEGEATINGFNVRERRDDVRRSIGLVFQDPSLDDRLTAEENLRFHARLYGVAAPEYKKRIDEVLALVELSDRRDSIVRTFSGGMKRRLEIARGLIHYPKVLFLDEPTLGLDPQTRAHLWEYIFQLKRDHGMTVFMTTHYLQEAEYCDRIAVIDRGRIVALDTPSALKVGVGKDTIFLKSKNLGELREEVGKRYGGIATIAEEDETLRLSVVDGGAFLPRLFNELDTAVESVELRRPTLDDVFLSLTGKKIREEEASGQDRMREQFLRRR
ncbi:MAG: ATP-binding cassette domain-containing protein [Candidatus Terrybacteria bacterium]|nr:ATP-binding cassette domain-containing protein [Candidatus Terrybacteria bacterium]